MIWMLLFIFQVFVTGFAWQHGAWVGAGTTTLHLFLLGFRLYKESAAD